MRTNPVEFMMTATSREIADDYFAELDAEEAHMVAVANVRAYEYAEFPMGEFPPL